MAYLFPVRKTMFYRTIALLAFGIFFVEVFVWQAAQPSFPWGSSPRREFAAVGSLAGDGEVVQNTEVAANFSADELEDIVTPAVVRVIQHISGTVVLAGFSVDAASLTFTPAPLQKKIPIDVYASGAGFFVNPDGYALVSARTVSLEGAKQVLITRTIEMALSQSVVEPSGGAKNERHAVLKANIARYLREKSVFHLEQTSVIANPSSPKKKVADLFTDGYPVRILSANEHFLEDGRDVALVHIDQEGVPALALSGVVAPEVGTSLFVAGVPFSHAVAAAPVGAVTSSLIKNTLGGAVRGSAGVTTLFATDAHLAPEMSGAPIVNQDGTVVGMAVFVSKLPLAQSEMSPAFMLGVSSLRDELTGRFIIPREGVYSVAVRKGIDLLHNRRCSEALAAFTEARRTNALFFSADRLTAYEGQCDSFTIGGISLTLLWEDIQNRTRSLNRQVRLAILGGASLLIILLVIVVHLSRKVTKERALHRINENLTSKKTPPRSILGLPRQPVLQQKYKPSPTFLKPTHFPYVRKKVLPPLLTDTPESSELPPVSPIASVPLISSVPRELVIPPDAVEQKIIHQLSDEEEARILKKKSPSRSLPPTGPIMEGGILSGIDEAIGLERPRDPRLRTMLHQLATEDENSAAHHHMPAADALWALPDDSTAEHKDDMVQAKEFVPPDVDPTVFAYVRDAHRSRMSREMITEELTRAGWPREAIKRALDARDR
ncbi:MAG: serine protease [bacterium]|nr:serine protease [bacterium]MDZ4299633.1 serine protease [Candidatus Sungbacteria bacterium]